LSAKKSDDESSACSSSLEVIRIEQINDKIETNKNSFVWAGSDARLDIRLYNRFAVEIVENASIDLLVI
jgi:hypothetical protein